MPCTGDRELYFDVLRALTEEKLTEGKSLRTFPRQMYYPTTGAEIWLLQTPAAERAPPGIQHWETQFERFRATEKKQTQRLGGRQSKHQNSWRWTNMYLGGGDHKWICCLTGVEYSRTNLTAETRGTCSVWAWWWVDYKHVSMLTELKCCWVAEDRVQSSEVMTLAAYKGQRYSNFIHFSFQF